ncbi:MAG: indole-3-glycerol phosphate synthase TrpC [Deltaproteobacteria bacterium]|nr:indole-3-glycerol phosphate synthase TrpC [Deltaproteobacteria bacterium]
MHAVLHDILQAKKRDVDRLLRSRGSSLRPAREMPVRDFRGAVTRRGGTSLIAEIKYASPSAGLLRKPEDPARLAGRLEAAGAAALSLVTEQAFFGGSPEHLSRVSRATSIPVLCKDFILHEIQVAEAYGRGADAVLLIARILPGDRLACLLGRCAALGMAALVEVHDGGELDRALAAGAWIIGVNNRDLGSFRVGLETIRKLAPRVPRSVTLVSESGIRCAGDVATVRGLGVQAVLVGTALMKAVDPAAAAGRLVDAGKACGRLSCAAEKADSTTSGERPCS